MVMTRFMHAVQYNSYGGGASALKHVDVPKEVLIKLEVASINPFEWKIQKGFLWPLLPLKFPCIPANIPWSTFETNLNINGKVIDITPRARSILTFLLHKVTFSKKQLVPLIAFLPKGEDLQFLVDLVKEGKLRTVIDSKYHITKAEDGWAKIIFEF